jgi:hypothetical protein
MSGAGFERGVLQQFAGLNGLRGRAYAREEEEREDGE